jgi:hypothetical protein
LSNWIPTKAVASGEVNAHELGEDLAVASVAVSATRNNSFTII